MLVSMLLGYAVALVGIGLFAQGWRQVYRARQNDRLVTDGLYGYVRHPQYTGLFIALFGEGIIHWPTVFSVGLFPLVVVVFAWLARKEERDMVDKFGEDYQLYQQNVPMFLPDWGKWREIVAESRNHDDSDGP
jgi:protein-S-isoprenylcysteine O-methyltransferase Ste14